MQGEFFVYASWTEPEELIGIISSSIIHGKERISFTYDDRWILRHPGLFLDPEVLSFPGRQYPEPGKDIFGFLADASPDRWGKRLIDRREIIQAKKEDRSIHKLFASDYLLGVHDGGRVGGLRFKADPDGKYLSDEDVLAAPPMTELRRLENASLEYERCNDPYEEKWLRDLLVPGSSLGGARPKANVVDSDGSLWIAKFPSRNDIHNSGAWEMVVHDLAKDCGIRVPEARLMHFSESGDTFLVKRFDRVIADGKLRRLHFASAMTMLGETDGTEHPVSYLDLAQILEEYGSQTKTDLKELWQRLVFTAAVSNTDNHLRNHGFLLFPDGWHLSPAYDLNPSFDRDHLALSITENDDSVSLNLARETAPYFRVTDEEADHYIRNVKLTVSEKWRRLAARYGISKSEQELMKPAFRECL